MKVYVTNVNDAVRTLFAIFDATGEKRSAKTIKLLDGPVRVFVDVDENGNPFTVEIIGHDRPLVIGEKIAFEAETPPRGDEHVGE